ncbi:Fc.00g024650.m01.CDS01 [Cosmosporella sp. VM-42]
MYCLPKLAFALILNTLANAVPQKAAPEGADIERRGEHGPRAIQETTTSSTTLGPPDCSSGGECDCSGIADKNSEQYFQCITNARCEVCWNPTLVPTATTPPSTSTDYHTMPPGTYTTTSNGTVHVIIVGPVTAPPAKAAETTHVAATASDTKAASASGVEPVCPSKCDCSKIEDQESEE